MRLLHALDPYLDRRRGGSDFFDGDCAISRPPDPRGLPGQGLRLTFRGSMDRSSTQVSKVFATGASEFERGR